MIRATLIALLSHWRRRPGQLATLLLGIALATALFSAVQAINGEARAAYAKAEARIAPNAPDRLESPTGQIPTQTFLALRAAGWLVSPVWEGMLASGTQIEGYDFLSLPFGALPTLAPSLQNATPDSLISLSPPAWAAPETITSSTVQGLIPAPGLAPDQIITTIDRAIALAPQGKITHLFLAPESAQPLNRPPLSSIAPTLIRSTSQSATATTSLTRSFHLNLMAFGLLASVVGLFIAHGAIGLAFEQRRPMLRTLRAIGIPTSTIAALMLTELALLALLAGGAGLIAGHFTAAALLPDVSASIRGLTGAEIPGQLSLRPGWAATGLAIALIGALLAGLSSFLRLARLPILAGPRPRAWARASSRALLLQAFAGLGLMALGAAAVPLLGGLPGGFALLTGILLGAALILPATLALLLNLARRAARRPLAEWFWADALQQLPSLRLALMALLIALATNIGVGTMVSSFRLTFTGWLDQRLVSELYITARSEDEAARLRAHFTTLPQIRAVLPIWRVVLPLADQGEGELYGAVDHATYRDNWPLIDALPGAWDHIASGEGVLINEQLSRRAGLAPGDTIALTPAWQTKIVGVYSDYGNPAPQAITSLEALTTHFPDTPRLRYGLRVAPEDIATVTKALIAFGLAPETITPNAEIKAYSLSIFERTFAVTAALNVLTLAVAALAILTAMLTLASLRLPQLAPVWAIGVTRSRLAALEAARTLALAAFTAAFALPLGLALAWCLLTIVNTEAFGWRLPVHLFPGQWLSLFATALLAAAAAALFPVLKLHRTSPTAFLKVFASERL